MFGFIKRKPKPPAGLEFVVGSIFWAMDQLFYGRRVKQKDWADDCYLYVDIAGLVYDQYGKPYQMDVSDIKYLNWEIRP